MGIGSVFGAIGGVAGPALAGYGQWKPESDRRDIEGAQEKDRRQGLLDEKIQKQRDREFSANLMQAVVQGGGDPAKTEQGLAQVIQNNPNASPEKQMAAMEMLEQMRQRSTAQKNTEWERGNLTAAQQAQIDAQKMPYERQTATSVAGNANARYMHDTPSPEHIEQYKSQGKVWDGQKGEFVPNPNFKKMQQADYQKFRKDTLAEWKELYTYSNQGKRMRDPGSPDFETYFFQEAAKLGINAHEYDAASTDIPAGDKTPFRPWTSGDGSVLKQGGGMVAPSPQQSPQPSAPPMSAPPQPVPITGAPAQPGAIPVGGNAIGTNPLYRNNRPTAPAPAQAAPAPTAPPSPQMAPAQQDTVAAIQPLLPLIKQLQAQNPQKPLAQIIAELGLPPEMLPIIKQSLGQ